MRALEPHVIFIIILVNIIRVITRVIITVLVRMLVKFISSATSHVSPSAGHNQLYHFACLALKGYPSSCNSSCMRHLLLQRYMEHAITDCWQIGDVPEGGLTAWVVDFDYITKQYRVLFDTGAARDISFDGEEAIDFYCIAERCVHTISQQSCHGESCHSRT